MNKLLSLRKIPCLEFIQPKQYHATARHFTEQEINTAVDKSGLTREAITQGYPELLLSAASLRASGVNVYSAVNIFDEERETVYFDNCCHLNERRTGNICEVHSRQYGDIAGESGWSERWQ